MSRRKFFTLSLTILLMLSLVTPAAAQGADPPKPTHSGTVMATNGIYDIFVEDVNSRIGTYTVRTGANHPITIAGSPQNVLFGGTVGSPGTSFNTIRSYTTHTDYVTGPNHTSSYSVINLDAYTTGTTSIGTTIIRTTWSLPGPPATPDRLDILQDIEIIGSTFADTSVKVKLQVTNPNFSAVALGVRYLWDFQIGNDDGPVFTPLNLNGSVSTALTKEAAFQPPAFVAYQIQDNDINSNPPMFGVNGSATPPSELDPIFSAPGIMQFVCWPRAFPVAFEYMVDPNRDIATTASLCSGGSGGDTAVSYLFGPSEAGALQVGSTQTLTLTAYLLAATPEDTDGDGLFDVWETNDTDLNGDGVIDVGPSLGADPNRKDVYVEIDWMEDDNHSHKPDSAAIQQVVDAFGAQDINLHVDMGPNSVDYVTGNTWGQYAKGSSIAHQNLIGGAVGQASMAEEWTSLKDANFGHSDKVFRHTMFVHEYSINGVRSGSSGIALKQFLLVSLGLWDETVNQQAGTFMHELGHTLGLKHGGNEDDDPGTPLIYDDFYYKPNYLSVMSYSFQMSGLIINGTDGHFDYSQFDLPDLNEVSLLESNGLNDAQVSTYSTKYKVHFPYLCAFSNPTESLAGRFVLSNGAQQIDWDCDGSIDTQSVQEDINGRAGSAQVLTSWDDWANLQFKVGNIGMAGITAPLSISEADIASLPPELTYVESLNIQQISDPRVQLTATANPTSVTTGGTVTYTISMLNIDGQAANDVAINDTLPAGFTYVPNSTHGATTNNPTVNGQTLTWSPFLVPANGGVLTLTFQATASSITGTYTTNVSGASSNGYVTTTGDTAAVDVVSSSLPFPASGILDNFNRANGSIGSNWYGNTSGYNISSNQLLVKSRNANLDIYWSNTTFGPNQEAYFTFSSVKTTALDQDLLLKSQYNYGWGGGLIDVQYEAAANRVIVWTYDHNQSWVQYGADIPVTFANGDQFGARALSNGTVEVYRNGVLIATRDISAWPYNASGGYIGVWFGNAKDALIDDFGGGTLP